MTTGNRRAVNDGTRLVMPLADWCDATKRFAALPVTQAEMSGALIVALSSETVIKAAKQAANPL